MCGILSLSQRIYVVKANLYTQQLQLFYDVSCRALVNRGYAIPIVTMGSSVSVRISRGWKCSFTRPTDVVASNYHLFRAMAHLLHERRVNSLSLELCHWHNEGNRQWNKMGYILTNKGFCNVSNLFELFIKA